MFCNLGGWDTQKGHWINLKGHKLNRERNNISLKLNCVYFFWFLSILFCKILLWIPPLQACKMLILFGWAAHHSCLHFVCLGSQEDVASFHAKNGFSLVCQESFCLRRQNTWRKLNVSKGETLYIKARSDNCKYTSLFNWKQHELIFVANVLANICLFTHSAESNFRIHLKLCF